MESEATESSLISGTNQEGSKELSNILGEKAFNYPKPPSLLRGLVDQSTAPGDLVLDFFAGSGTTAQAVAELNARDAETASAEGGSAPEPRRWIMVSSTEATADDGDKNIARDVAARRLAALGLDFAYLRMRSAPVAAEAKGLGETWIRPSLELLLGASVARDKAASGEIPWVEGSDFVFAYLSEIDSSTLDRLDAFRPPAGKTAVLAAFQPGPLRQRLGDRSDFRILALPDFLIAAITGSAPGARA